MSRGATPEVCHLWRHVALGHHAEPFAPPVPTTWVVRTGGAISFFRRSIPVGPVPSFLVWRGRLRPSARKGLVPRGSSTGGVEGNARLTGTVAAVLLVLLAAEGVTVLRVGALLNLHVFIGMLLVPPIAVEIGSTGYRFIRYYSGSPAYRRKGRPRPCSEFWGRSSSCLQSLLFASGIVLLFARSGLRRELLFIHRISFFLWFAAMTVHALGHIRDTARLAPGTSIGAHANRSPEPARANGPLPPAWS